MYVHIVTIWFEVMCAIGGVDSIVLLDNVVTVAYVSDSGLEGYIVVNSQHCVFMFGGTTVISKRA